MGKTNIEWTRNDDGTSGCVWNPTTGCTKVSQGCKHCYAERDWKRLSKIPTTVYAGRDFTNVLCHPERLDQPIRWKRPRRIFVNSMSDLFHEDIPDAFLDQVFAVMALCGQHVFQVLTKRPGRMCDYVNRLSRSEKRLEAAARILGYSFVFDGIFLVSWPLKNVWLGVSCEDQETADSRIPLLLKTDAAIRWISAEPLLGPILIGGTALDWVVCGGESGPSARRFDIGWALQLLDQCQRNAIPFFMKQLGAQATHCDRPWDPVYTTWQHQQDRKGANMQLWPEDLRVREYPT